MPTGDLDALVIGAGVSGLTTAVCLAEAGLRVRIRSAAPPEQSTSVAAGALWRPYLIEPPDKVRVWRQRTLTELRRLATMPGTGVRLAAGMEAATTAEPIPDWAHELEGFRECRPDELPAGFLTGWRYVTPLADMPTYLGYLRRRLAAAGGTVEIAAVRRLADAATEAPIVVNCTGIGARDLVPDPEVTAVRGQVVVVANPGLTDFFAEHPRLVPDLRYFFPHGHIVVLGGQAAPGNDDMNPDPDLAAAIIARCAEVEPRLRGARVLGHRVGLRPSRPQVRVAAEPLGGATLIHNYGHGGAGVTVSWGCAAEVARLASLTAA